MDEGRVVSQKQTDVWMDRQMDRQMDGWMDDGDSDWVHRHVMGIIFLHKLFSCL